MKPRMVSDLSSHGHLLCQEHSKNNTNLQMPSMAKTDKMVGKHSRSFVLYAFSTFFKTLILELHPNTQLLVCKKSDRIPKLSPTISKSLKDPLLKFVM